MALQKDDIDKLTSILNGKVSDRAINRIIDQANTASFYYELKDSPFNRPTTWKVFALLVFLFCSALFVIQPLFFWKNWQITDIVNKNINETVELWWLPPLTSFTYDIYIKDVVDNSEKKVFELVDLRWNIMARTDIINWYGSAIFWNLWNWLEVKKDLDIITTANGVLAEDMKENIKEILTSWLRYDIYIPEFKSFDYWTDNIINGWN